MCHPFYILHIKHFFGHMTNIAHLGETHDQHRTLLESRDEYRTLSSHTTNAATVLHVIFIWTAPSAFYIDAFSLAGDAKRLRLPHFNDYLSVSDNFLPFDWFSISGNLLFLLDSPSCRQSTHAKTIHQLKHGGECCTWTNGTQDAVSIDNTALG